MPRCSSGTSCRRCSRSASTGRRWATRTGRRLTFTVVQNSRGRSGRFVPYFSCWRNAPDVGRVHCRSTGHGPASSVPAPNGVEYGFRRLYYDTASAANRPSMAALTSLVPISRVLFGADYPFVPSIARTLEALKTVGFSEAELQAIERNIALALLPRVKAAVATA